jgi:hypothetical protein
MADLDKVFNNLLAISRGDIATLSRATDGFARDVIQQTAETSMDSSASPPAMPTQTEEKA